MTGRNVEDIARFHFYYSAIVHRGGSSALDNQSDMFYVTVFLPHTKSKIFAKCYCLDGSAATDSVQFYWLLLPVIPVLPDALEWFSTE